MNEEKLFVVCNIPKLLEKQLKDIREQCIDNMSTDNLAGYDYVVAVHFYLSFVFCRFRALAFCTRRRC